MSDNINIFEIAKMIGIGLLGFAVILTFVASLPILIIMGIIYLLAFGLKNFKLIPDEMTNSILMLFMLVAMIIAVICFIINFICVVDFKWHIDYFISKNAVCEKLRWTAFEIESMRYNFASFLKGSKFEQIKKDFESTYAIITAALSILISFAALLVLIVNKKNIVKAANSRISENLQPYYWILFAATPILLIYAAVAGKYTTNFKEIQEDGNLSAYYNVYKIVSAVMVLSGMKDVELKYSFEGLGKDTLDNILEKNIASYEDVHVSSKVKEIKQEAYQKLDFLKYLVFDKYSPYYLPYFDNIYMKYKMSDNRFLEDLYLNYENAMKKEGDKPQHFRTNISGQLNDIITELKDDRKTKLYALFGQDKTKDRTQFVYENKDKDNLYNLVIDKLKETNTNDPKITTIEGYKKDETNETNYITEIKTHLNYNKTSLDEIYKDYTNISNVLKKMNTAGHSKLQAYTNTNKYIENAVFKNEYIPYIKLNSEIGSLLSKAGVNLDVQEKDYIKYYIEHKDMLTTETKLDDIFKRIREQSDYIYMYYIYLSLIFLFVLHYVFKTTDAPTYLYSLAGILLAYILFIWIYTQLSFLG